MEKKKLKRLLISTLIIIFSTISYICAPFFINFDDAKVTNFENLLSETIKYRVSVKGGIQYKLKPFPILEISEVHIAKENENSILNKIILRISILDLLKKKYSYKKKIILDGGELIVDLNNLNDVMFINDFQNQKVIFRNLSLKFFSNKQSFNLDQVNGEILYNDRKIKKIKTQTFIGEVPFEITFKESQLDLISKKIGINLSLKNIFEKEKNLKFTFDNQTIFPGINEIYASLKLTNDNNSFVITSEKFQTNLFDGNIIIEKSNKTANDIVIKSIFNKANLKKIHIEDFKNFLEKDLYKLSNILDARILINFKKIKTQKKLFNSAKFEILFQKGDVIFEDITFSSDKAKINIKGRNINYQKDNLLFYDIFFETKDLKEVCKTICEDKSLNDKIVNNEIKLYSKGILNINKAKVIVKENNFIKQYNDNEIKKLNDNLNTKVILGKLENLLDLSKYFNLL